MSDGETGSSGSESHGGGGLSGLLDQLIDAHDQVYNLVSSALSGGGGSSSSGGGGASRTAPPANDVPIFEGSAEEMLSAEDMDMEDMKSPLEGMAEQVMGDIFERQMGPQTPWEHVQAFKSAINWTEPLIVSLLIFQLIMFVATLLVIRRGGTASRFGMLVFIAIVVRAAEKMNEYAGGRWEDIATQNYFDTNGVFVLIFIAVPLLGDCVLMLISFIREASRLLVEVKTMEMKQKKKKESNQTTSNANDSKKKTTGRGKRSKKED